MMEVKIYCPDIECDSCVKILSKVFTKLEGISKFLIKDTYIEVDFDESEIKLDTILKSIRNKGYRASLEPITRMRVRDRIKEFLKDKEKYELEYKILKGTGLSSIVLFSIIAILTYFMSQSNPDFLGSYGWWLFYLIISIVTIGGAIWHFKAYKARYTCMVGMMVGMTIGMQTGMMIGFILGATNGFFTGALAGMLISAVVGVYTGRCCGIMGVMEGVMAAIMGGTMGPMVSVMMYNESILWFLPPYMILNISILTGLSFMVFEEVVEDNKDITKKPISLARFILFSVIALLIILGIMFLTPASIYMR